MSAKCENLLFILLTSYCIFGKFKRSTTQVVMSKLLAGSSGFISNVTILELTFLRWESAGLMFSFIFSPLSCSLVTMSLWRRVMSDPVSSNALVSTGKKNRA